MLNVRIFNSSALRLIVARSSAPARNYSSTKKDDSDSDSDRETKSKAKPKVESAKEETAADRLNKLLASMQTDDKLLRKNINMARPGGNKKHAKKENDAKNIFEAAKNVAALLGDNDKQQTESELLSKLLNHKADPSQSAETGQTDEVNPNDLSLSELIVGMKIDRRQPNSEQSRGDYVRKTLAGRPGQRKESAGPRTRQQRLPERSTGSVNLFGSKPLDLFKDPSKLRELPDMLQTWQHLHQHELKLAVTHPPSNYFQKMALWTEQGKLWKFPIDNEQGLDEEHDTDFSEHVFLEQHLESWCPTKGPIRHFMELVCVGLSKNPYISAREKKEHILWYKDYFEQKKDIIKATIVEQKSTVNDTKTISSE